MHLLEKSLKIALTAHAGQTDKAGQPYILHPIRLMQKMDNELAMATALLHDVLEDSDYTEQQLIEADIALPVVEAVLCLTKRNNESYSMFIERVASNALASMVKIADLEDNMNMLRLTNLGEKDLQRLKKYHQAWYQLHQLIPLSVDKQ